MLAQASSKTDGSRVVVELPDGPIWVTGIHVDPGTADTTISWGASSVLIDFAGGPGPLPMAAPLRLPRGCTLGIANDDGSARVLVTYDTVDPWRA